MTDRAGTCQVCGKLVEGYSTDNGGRSIRAAHLKRVLPALPIRAEPCGHEQPRPVIWPAETPTFPPEG